MIGKKTNKNEIDRITNLPGFQIHSELFAKFSLNDFNLIIEFQSFVTNFNERCRQ